MEPKKINVIFLDYDGVINTDEENFEGYLENPEAIYYLNKFCLDNDFQIVVSSSWSRNPNYKQKLYDAGLDEKVKILGSTGEILYGHMRDIAIKHYLKEHTNIDKFLIIDDGFIGAVYKNNYVQTAFRKGFTKEKYLEALAKLDILNKIEEN